MSSTHSNRNLIRIERHLGAFFYGQKVAYKYSMNHLFYPTNFKLSEEATAWVIDKFQHRFTKNFNHNLDLALTQQQWRNGPVGKELLNFLSQYNCDTSTLIIGAQIANNKNDTMMRPHIDSYRELDADDNDFLELKNTRFNVFVLGTPEDEIYWWSTINHDDSRLIEKKTISPISQRTFKTMWVPGNTNREQIDYLGPHDYSASYATIPSAFLRTDCIHTLKLSKGPRLLVSVAFDKPLAEIINL